MNFKLIRVFDYIRRFNLKICHKFKKQNIVFDAFPRLAFTNIEFEDLLRKAFTDENELNAFIFIIMLIKMNEVFRNRLMKKYFKNSI